MTTQPKVYRRLTRNATGLGSYSSLWQGSDHLLIVTSTGYHETYARIMFSDIQAFFVTATGRRLWWGLVWTLIAVIAGTSVLISLGYSERPIVSAIVFALSAGALALNWYFGGGCRVHVMTGVQNTVLPALVRTRKTRAVLARLQPLIVATQADRVASPVEPVPSHTVAEPVPADVPAPPPPGTRPPETPPS